jgi:hypothetical protein
MTWIAIGPQGVAGSRCHALAHDDTWDAGPTLTAGWRMDGDRLEVHADRLGMIPLFCFHDDSRVVVADDIAELLAQVPRPRFDDAAVAVFLQLGFYVGDDTPFANIKVLAPGATLTWEHGKAGLDVPPLPFSEPFGGGWEEALPRFTELFEHAVSRRARLGVGRLTLSGGRDSRHLFLELLRQGTPPPAVITQDRPVHTDLDIARRLASRAGVPHIAVAPFRDGLAEELQKNRWNHYLSDENAWYLQIVSHLSGPLFDGLAGDILAGTNMFPWDRLSAAMSEKSPAGAANALLGVLGSGLYFLRAPFLKRWSREVAAERLAVELERHRHAAHPSSSFLFWNRTRREIALIPLCIAGRHVPVRLAYLDPPLMAFLSSLPHPAFSGADFHSYVMARTYPRFADVPFAARRKRPRSLARALEECEVALRFGFSPAVARVPCVKSMVKALIGGQPTRLAWLYRVLPLVQTSRELKVPLAPG